MRYSKLIRAIFLTVFFAVSLVSIGCTTKKALVKGAKDMASVSDDALQLFREGAALLYHNDKEALLKFAQAAEVDKTFFAAHFNAGVAAENLKDFGLAKERYERCLAVKKDQPNCLDNLILVELKQNQADEALTLSEQYLAQYPEAPFALVAAAKRALYGKDFENAEKLARLAIERDAENIEALFVMARIFYEKKQYSAALFVAKNALSLAPAHGGLLLLQGHINTALANVHDALEAYEQAVQYQPTEEALSSYALLLLKRGRAKDAIPLFKQLIEQNPEVSAHYLHAGNAYLAASMFEPAKEAYLKVLELNPADKDVQFNLGVLYLNLKAEGLSDLDRFKASQAYFKSYLEKPDLSKERIKEVGRYLESLVQKIEDEEYAIKTEKEAEEERALEKLKESEEKAKEQKQDSEENLPSPNESSPAQTEFE